MNSKPLSSLISGRDFDHFQAGLESRFAAYGLKYELTYSETSSDASMRLDFESLSHLGRVTVSESGHCDIEVLDIASGENVFYEYHQLNSDTEFHSTYPKLVIFMREASGEWPSAEGERA